MNVLLKRAKDLLHCAVDKPNHRYIIKIIMIIINNLFKVGVLNERLIAIKKLIKANYL